MAVGYSLQSARPSGWVEGRGCSAQGVLVAWRQVFLWGGGIGSSQ